MPRPCSAFVRRTYVYKTTADCDIHLDIYSPEGVSDPTPVVIWIHGGALIMGSRDGAQGHASRYLAAGYRVVSIDYRLAPETKLPEIVADVRDAFCWIRSNASELGIDGNRVGVVGHSGGGYLALMSGTFESGPQVIVSFYGYGDLVGDWYAKPDPFYLKQERITRERALEQVEARPISEGRRGGRFYLYTRQQGTWPLEVGGADPVKDPGFFTPFCPDQIAGADFPPTLLLHGTDDTDVPYDCSARMCNRLAAVGAEHALVTVEGGGHGFDAEWWKPQVKDAYAQVLAFLDSQLKL